MTSNELTFEEAVEMARKHQPKRFREDGCKVLDYGLKIQGGKYYEVFQDFPFYYDNGSMSVFVHIPERRVMYRHEPELLDDTNRFRNIVIDDIVGDWDQATEEQWRGLERDLKYQE
ncbi:hypothetical protein KRX51_03065 [Corynebacterium sp. TAE3-ERU12]|uniref:hypothetical protein n=1 Tax=Corynebacterium sp. TAE3-ERU12 TaxID=2849491 RepID=UPI001C4964CD|nr:hypothetical protein [Corynebacterium sp. TAE3-ERU12]MBV7294898.1 hypothetical protein [Corynebacterium sp. TAE3-ERU12]